jgi:uroporphyrin-III C-methyltransferase/precorrin-2 dehydrogenase/sirohydrochlorin ferrochelatase
VDDPDNATAYLSGVVRRDEVTLAISTSGAAPALTSLVREALDAVLPDDLADWVTAAREQRLAWRCDGVPMAARKPLLLRALNELYADPRGECGDGGALSRGQIPWLSGPEDSWL